MLWASTIQPLPPTVPCKLATVPTARATMRHYTHQYKQGPPSLSPPSLLVVSVVGLLVLQLRDRNWARPQIRWACCNMIFGGGRDREGGRPITRRAVLRCTVNKKVRFIKMCPAAAAMHLHSSVICRQDRGHDACIP